MIGLFRAGRFWNELSVVLSYRHRNLVQTGRPPWEVLFDRDASCADRHRLCWSDLYLAIAMAGVGYLVKSVTVIWKRFDSTAKASWFQLGTMPELSGNFLIE
jgi:hypothetical protein